VEVKLHALGDELHVPPPPGSKPLLSSHFTGRAISAHEYPIYDMLAG